MEVPKIYTVQSGDSLSRISQKLFGDFSMTDELARINKLPNANLIQPGQQLIIPDIKSTFVEAEVVSSELNTTKTTIGKIFPWLVVAVAGVLLAREASKQHKKNKSTIPAKKLSGPIKKEVTAKFIYEDDWNQKVYKGSDGKKYVEVDGIMHTMTSEGEANYPVRHVKKLDGVTKKKNKKVAKA